MNTRNIACIAAAIFIGGSLTAGASNAFAASPSEVLVQTKRFDPLLQRRVSYADLDLAVRPDRTILRQRITRTARELCIDLNADGDISECRTSAVDSTRGQFAVAVARAERMMAGLPVGPAVSISMVISAR